MGIAATIVAILKAIPAAQKIFEQSVTLFYSAQENADQTSMSEIDVERTAIVQSIKQPGLSDAQIRVFRKRLIALSSM